MTFDELAAKTQPYHKAIVFGAAIAFFGGLVIFGGMWALVIAGVCLFVGIMLGLIVGAELMRRDLADEMTVLRSQYEAASELAYKLNQELNAQVQRAESAERDLLTTAAEKTSLRHKLDAIQVDGTV
ncbi:hypothetical protein HII36_05670 [Nonomuraea sp. NN258]|uniref:hypothetical protein n=1 Tax=Nonomuraea antri TaxID=2730852 RepID=UPI00156A2331|nr:hypothetical protein [Nonomuraea antri]NRQ31327.1 hypothetical protein [Nonomuraea antri]